LKDGVSEALPLRTLRDKLLVIPGRYPLGKYEAVPAQVIGADRGKRSLIPSITAIFGTVICADCFNLAHGAPPLFRICIEKYSRFL